MNLKQYEKIWLDKVIDANKQFAHYNLMDDIIPKNDQLLSSFKTGGTRVRKHPMIGTDTSTYAPSVNAVPELVAETTNLSAGSKKGNKTAKAVSDFGTGFKQGFVAPFKLVGDAATAMSPVLPYVAMMGGGKGDELEKAKESLNKFMNNERKTKPSKKHLALLETNGIISKKSEEGGKVNRLNKAQKWTDFAVNTASSGLGLAEKAKEIAGSGKVNRLNKAQKWTDFAVNTASSGLGLAEKAKDIAGAGKSKGPSKWIAHVKEFSKKNNVPYKQALSQARESYKGGAYAQSF